MADETVEKKEWLKRKPKEWLKRKPKEWLKKNLLKKFMREKGPLSI